MDLLETPLPGEARPLANFGWGRRARDCLHGIFRIEAVRRKMPCVQSIEDLLLHGFLDAML